LLKRASSNPRYLPKKYYPKSDGVYRVVSQSQDRKADQPDGSAVGAVPGGQGNQMTEVGVQKSEGKN
jgi:hypothetical protein